MNKKKILIVSVSAGNGHVSAAQAIADTAATYPDIEVQHIDMMQYVSSAVRHAVVDIYDTLVKTMPALWGYIYEKTNDQKRVKKISKLIKGVSRFQARPFYQFIEEYRPDHIICTHSFPAQVIRQAKKLSIKEIPISLVVTDYGFHSYWLMPNISNYFVATEKMAWEMERRGMDKQRISVSGIPVRPVFFEDKIPVEIKKKLTIPDNARVVLILAGGQGMMESNIIVELIQQFSGWKQPLEVIAISGKNKKLYASLCTLVGRQSAKVQVQALAWTDTIDEYMRVADVIITKPGGSTTSECLTLGKEMIAIRPIPGQEDSNAAYIVEQGAGYIARTDDEVLYYMNRILSHPRSKEKRNGNPADVILKKVIAA